MYADARNTYLDSTATTASPARLLVMLVDRLELDVRRGLTAQEAHDHEAAHHQLVHAQQILAELAGSLDVAAFGAGEQLRELYGWLERRLLEANIRRDPTITASCLPLVSDLAGTWREAALQAAAVAP